MNDKLEKLNKMFSLLQDDTVKPSDIEQFLKLVLNVIKTSKDNFEQISQENLAQIALYLEEIKKNHSETLSNLDDKKQTAINDFEAKVKEITSIVEEVKKIRQIPGIDGYTPIKGVDYFDGETGLPGADGSPDTPKQIKEKLESLTGTKRLDISAIKGAEKLTTQANLDRAISILDQRTQFLINKTGGSGTSSPLTTKGDLYTFSTDNARLGVGTNDQVLVADSTEATGLKWKALGSIAVGGFTPGSVMFADSTGTLGEDNANFFWDDTNNRLGIGTTSPATKLHVVSNELTFAAETTSDINLYTTPGVGKHFNFYNVRQDADYVFKQNVGGSVGTTTLIIKGNTGNVGIGTTSPTKTLDVAGTGRFISASLPLSSFVTTSGNDITQFGMTGATNNPYLAIRPDETNKVISLRADGLAAYPSLTFQTGGSERLRIDTAGNVGIGTTTPGARFEVVDNSLTTDTVARVSQDDANVYGLIIGNNSWNTAKNYGLAFYVDNGGKKYIGSGGGTATDLILQSTGGNVGIGTTTPSNALDVVSSATYTTIGITNIGAGGASAFTLNNTANQTGNRNWGFTSNDIAWGDFTFKQSNVQGGNPLTAGTSRLYISPTGNVGIGVIAPDASLHVNGATINTDRLALSTDGVNTWRFRHTNDNTDSLAIGNDVGGTFATRVMTLARSGNVGIGTTSPGAQLQINTSSASTIGSIIRGATSQTADLMQWQKSDGTVYAAVIGGVPSSSAVGNFTLYDKGLAKVATGAVLSVHADDSSPYLAKFYNDTKSATLAEFAYYGYDNGNFSMGTFLGKLFLGAGGSEASGSTTRMTIDDSTGHIGIGTTSPGQKLDVVGTIRATTEAAILGNVTGGVIAQRPSDDSVLYFGFRTTPDAWVIGASYATTGAYKPMLFATSDTERMRITTAGNVGIGTTSPDEKLEVSGNTLISNNNFYKAKSLAGTKYSLAGITSGNIVQIGAIDYTTAGTTFAGGDNSQFTTGGASGDVRMSIINNGNVGMGTITPAANLHIKGDTAGVQGISTSQILQSGADGYNGLSFYTNAGLNATTWQFEDSTKKLYLYTNTGTVGVPAWSTRMTVQNDGNIGIGTASPSGLLHIAGTSYFDGNMYITSGDGVADDWHINYDVSNTGLNFTEDGIADGRLFLKDGGNVGIGTTTPKTLLTIGSANGGSAVVATNNKVWVKGEGAVSATAPQARIDVGFNDNPDYAAYFGSINDTYTTGAVLGTRSGGTDYATIYMKSGSVAIGTNVSTASAKVEISSTTQGFLPPRMTTTERNAISSPAEGLIVYDLTTHNPWFFDGTNWVAM